MICINFNASPIEAGILPKNHQTNIHDRRLEKVNLEKKSNPANEHSQQENNVKQ